MGKAQREKGANGERELAGLLYDELGIQFERQLRQYQAGGFDLAPKPGQPQIGYVIEVKRQECENLHTWWCEAHEKGPDNPVLLFFRRSRQPWKCLVDLNVLMPEAFPRAGEFAIIPFQSACTLIRESAHA